MSELVHVTVRIEASTRDALKEIAKARMMSTGEVTTLADMIRQGLNHFTRPLPSDSLLVDATLEQLEVLTFYLEKTGVPVKELADQFMAEADLSDGYTVSRIERVMPVLDELSRLASEIDLEGRQ